ncbi:MAG: STM3941 family protein [Deinococcota bacterium]
MTTSANNTPVVCLLEPNAAGDIVIYSSKVNLWLLTLGSFALAGLGASLQLITPPASPQAAIFATFLSIISVLFFGVCGVYGIFRLMQDKPALIINVEGVVDNSSLIAVGPVAWQDISTVSVSEYRGMYLVTLEVSDPQKYMPKRNLYTRLLAKLNLRFFRSSIQISASTLQVNFNQLERTIEAYHARYG